MELKFKIGDLLKNWHGSILKVIDIKIADDKQEKYKIDQLCYELQYQHGKKIKVIYLIENVESDHKLIKGE